MAAALEIVLHPSVLLLKWMKKSCQKMLNVTLQHINKVCSAFEVRTELG
jgi:hypothetical protein